MLDVNAISNKVEENAMKMVAQTLLQNQALQMAQVERLMTTMFQNHQKVIQDPATQTRNTIKKIHLGRIKMMWVETHQWRSSHILSRKKEMIAIQNKITVTKRVI
uniref:Histone-lysine N-methyltransferase ASHR1 n=1 Tax=Rhabditophanes sp. KR3021 TaxID=114890 RepID=A0AC35TTF6_9BILA